MRKIDVSKARIPGTDLQGWPAVVVAALGVYILLFVIVNDRKLEVDFVLFSVKSNELLALLVILALGFAAGFIVRGRLRPTPHSVTEPPALEPAPETTPARVASLPSELERGEGHEPG